MGKYQHHPPIMLYQIRNLGMLKLIYAHHYYRKQETPRFPGNPSKYLTTMKTMDIHQNKAHLAISKFVRMLH